MIADNAKKIKISVWDGETFFEKTSSRQNFYGV